MKPALIIALFLITSLPAKAAEIPLASRLQGKILLQVQDHGKAWYVNPKDQKRYYMKDGATAYEMMRKFGHGISESDFKKAENGDEEILEQMKGHIMLRVQSHGEAYYVHPEKLTLTYLKDGNAAYSIMRMQSLGITNSDIEKIDVNELFISPIIPVAVDSGSLIQQNPVPAPIAPEIIPISQNSEPVSEPSEPAPIPPPPSDPASSTSNEVPVSEAYTIEIVSPISLKGLGREYFAISEEAATHLANNDPGSWIDESNYIYLGAVIRDANNEEILKTPTVTVTATDAAQNKTLVGTGNYSPMLWKENKTYFAGYYYPFNYEFYTPGTHTITFSSNGATASVSLQVE